MQTYVLDTPRNLRTLLLAAMILMFSLAACGPTEDLPDTGGLPDNLETLEELPPKAVLDTVNKLSQDINISVEQIQILEFEQVDWSDACLEIPQTDETACAQVVTPGFRVALEANGQTYEFHTNEDGTVILQALP